MINTFKSLNLTDYCNRWGMERRFVILKYDIIRFKLPCRIWTKKFNRIEEKSLVFIPSYVIIVYFRPPMGLDQFGRKTSNGVVNRPVWTRQYCTIHSSCLRFERNYYPEDPLRLETVVGHEAVRRLPVDPQLVAVRSLWVHSNP